MKSEKRTYQSPQLEVICIDSEEVMVGSSKYDDTVVADENTEFGDEPGFNGGRSAEYRRGWDNGR